MKRPKDAKNATSQAAQQCEIVLAHLNGHDGEPDIEFLKLHIQYMDYWVSELRSYQRKAQSGPYRVL